MSAPLTKQGRIKPMDVLSSRILLRPTDLARSQHFYRDVLGLAIAREFGPEEHPGIVFYLGNGLLEVSGTSQEPGSQLASLWIQVRDVEAELARLEAAGCPIDQPAEVKPWGLIEAWISDPDGVKIVLVQIPQDHPLRRDLRKL